MARQQASLTVEAHSALARTAAYAGGLVERRVTMSAVLVAALTIARAHPDELRAVLAAGTEGAQ